MRFGILTSLAGLANMLASWTRCRALPLSVFNYFLPTINGLQTIPTPRNPHANALPCHRKGQGMQLPHAA